jgi:predicted nucleotidyltransferase component of viral defense system
VLDDSSLALKGGTAINLFIMNMPRLSVDIDLTFTKVTDRLQFLKDIGEVFEGFQTRLKAYTIEIFKTSDGIPKQARISNRQSQIKIDLNLILRGTVFPPSERTLCEKASIEFEKSVTVNCVSFEDLYAGKFCAALDRQHPRDLYDIKLFFEQYTFTEQLRKAFLIYLISSNRPIHELVCPNLLDQRDVYQREVVGMVEHPVNYEELESARLTLINTILSDLTANDKKFLVSINQGKPKWGLIDLDHVQDLPGVKWKLININKMTHEKREEDVNSLRNKLKL